MILGYCVGAMDEKQGPTPIFQKNLTMELAKKLVLKVMIGVMSFSAETSENSLKGESIIPFLKEGLITFAYLFPIKDLEARGGLRQCSLIVAFNAENRKVLYENASSIAVVLKDMSEEIELKHIQKKDFPEKLVEKFDLIQKLVFSEAQADDIHEKTMVKIVCPQCQKSSEIEFSVKAKGVNFIEHFVEENEICSHSFTVYLDSKFNILGYKDPEVELNEMKSLLGKLKSPYD